MSSRPRSRLLTALSCVLALAGVAVLAGCTSNPAPSGGKITLGFSAWPGFFPWQVAQEQGLFAKNGVNVDLKYFDNYSDSVAALSSGAIDANSERLNDTLSAVSGGAKVTVVLVNDNSTGNDQIIAANGISSLADLKGKRIAVEAGTVDHYLLLLALQQSHLGSADVELAPMPTANAATAFATGQVDAVGLFAPYTTKALGRAGSRPITTSAEFPGDLPDDLVVTPKLVKEHPQDVQGLVNTWFDALAWIKANPDQAAAIMAKRAGVSVLDYRSYAPGTTLFTRQQNIDAFTPGTTSSHLDFEANKIADFIEVQPGLSAHQRPSLDGLFDDEFVQAAPQ